MQPHPTSEKVDICFERLPTWNEAWSEGMLPKLCLEEWALWPVGWLMSGRYYHVYMVHNDTAYHISMLDGPEIRFRHKTDKPALTFSIRVDRDNLTRAKLFVTSEEYSIRTAPWRNCNHQLGVLLYGDKHHYTSWFGLGWFTRRVLYDVQRIQAAQR